MNKPFTDVKTMLETRLIASESDSKKLIGITTPTVRTIAHAIALEYQNHYVTIAKFAEHNGIYEQDALELIQICNRIISKPHPDA